MAAEKGREDDQYDSGKQKTDGEIFVDYRHCRIYRDAALQGESCQISEKAIDILIYLYRHSNRLVCYEELIEQVWRGSAKESLLYNHIAILRRALGDKARAPTFIKTVPKRGYQFIGRVEVVHFVPPLTIAGQEQPVLQASAPASEPCSFDDSVETTLTTADAIQKSYKNGVFSFVTAVLCIALIVVIFTSFYIDESSPEPQSADASVFKEISESIPKPKYVVVLEVDDLDIVETGSKRKALLSVLGSLLNYHLQHNPELAVMKVPAGGGALFYSRLQEHLQQPIFSEIGKNVYRIRLNWFEGKVHFLLEQSLLSEGMGQFSRSFAALDVNNFDYEGFEQKSLLALNGLVENQPIVTSHGTRIKSLLRVLEALISEAASDVLHEQAIARLHDILLRHPEDPLTSELLIDQIFYILDYSGNFNLEKLLRLFDFSSRNAIKHRPSDYKSSYARAEYLCIMEDYQACAEYLQYSFELQPYSTMSLSALSWNLVKFDFDSDKAARYNFELNPFGKNTFRFYRNQLLQQHRFSEVNELLHRYRQLNVGSVYPNWYLDAQVQTSPQDRKRFSQWFQSNDNVEDQNSYIAYNLLDSNRPEQALQALDLHNSRQSLFFDLKALRLMSLLWTGHWDDNEWHILRAFAMDRREHQNTMDKLRIAYFDLYSLNVKAAFAMIEEVYPQFKNDRVVVDADNFRFASYYAQCLRLMGSPVKASRITALQSTFLEQGGGNNLRSAFWGLSLVEFYALNNQPERALSALEDAINNRGWMPTSYWLWPPLMENRFLKSLHQNGEFLMLNSKLEKQLL